jgi:hypothetical protein
MASTRLHSHHACYALCKYKHDVVVKIRDDKEKPEWLRDDFWNELSEHIEQDDVKAKSKFMSDIAGRRPSLDGPPPITAITVGAELVSILLDLLPCFCHECQRK